MKKQKQSRKTTKIAVNTSSVELFNPDDIATQLHQILRRDFLGGGDQISLYGPPSPKSYFASAQVDQFLKKYIPQKGMKELNSKLSTEACQRFLDVNNHVRDANNRILKAAVTIYDNPRFLPLKVRQDDVLVHALLVMRNLWELVFGRITLYDLFVHCKHSQGVSAGLSFVKTNTEDKLVLPMTAGSEEVIKLAKLYLSWDTALVAAIRTENPNFDTLDDIDTWFRIASSTRTSSVAKNASARRLIAVEATWDMFFQQGILALMRKCLSFLGIDLEVDDYNHQRYAQTASVTLSEATIDHRSASDTVAYELVRFSGSKTSLFKLMDRVTRRNTDLREVGVTDVPLAMFSTMGNAITFPLETFVFFSVGLTAIMRSVGDFGGIPNLDLLRTHHLSVYGDDVIIASSAVPSYFEVAAAVGLLINEEKSHYLPTDPFRESCGGDFYLGQDVRPFHLKEPHDTRVSSLGPWMNIIVNQLYKKYILYFGVGDAVKRFQSVLDYCISVFSSYDVKVYIVPGDYPDDSGIQFVDREIYELLISYPNVQPWRITVDDQLIFQPSKKYGQYYVTFNYYRFKYQSNTYDKYRSNLDTGYWLYICSQIKSSWVPSLEILPLTSRILKGRRNYMPKNSNPVWKYIRDTWVEQSASRKYQRKRIGGYEVGRGLVYQPNDELYQDLSLG
jgi:hypothetical protein